MASYQVRAESLSCELILNLIENSSSSEFKSLSFEISLEETNYNIINGFMVTTSCFNVSKEDFKSNGTEVIINRNTNYIDGVIRNSNLTIGEHNYKMEMNLSNKETHSELAVKGNLLSLDDNNFIHQVISGECKFIARF